MFWYIPLEVRLIVATLVSYSLRLNSNQMFIFLSGVVFFMLCREHWVVGRGRNRDGNRDNFFMKIRYIFEGGKGRIMQVMRTKSNE